MRAAAGAWASAPHRRASRRPSGPCPTRPGALRRRRKSQGPPSAAAGHARRARAVPPRPAGHMVPDLSAELLGNIFSVGVTAGLPTPELLLLLERCWTTGRTGRMGGGRSCAPARRADRAGLKVVIISVDELLLRRMAASGSRMTMVCRGLAGSELMGPGGFFRGSRVSSTTSGACLTVFCLSSSRNSCRAVLMVFSMSCRRKELWSAQRLEAWAPVLPRLLISLWAS